MASGQDRAETLERWYGEHATALLRLAMLRCGERSVAEDVVHDAFLRCLAADPGPAAGNERSYLRRAVMNVANNHHRAQRRSVMQPVPQPTSSRGPDELVIGRTVTDSVAAAVRELPPRQRDCVLLHYYVQLSDVEIADELGLSAGTVKTHLHRARAALRPILEDLR